MYKQKAKEANSTSSSIETPRIRMWLARDILKFLRIKVEAREERLLQLRHRPSGDEGLRRISEETYDAEHILSASALTGLTLPVNPA